jgi:7-cyano-7-deazaguanine reductase
MLKKYVMQKNSSELPTELLLGKTVSYPSRYDASLLFTLKRFEARQALGMTENAPLPFCGWDLWNAYELSWLNNRGLPKIALLRLKIPCNSPNIIESKSFKLYLNSFNQTRFDSMHEVFDCLRVDLAQALGADIDLELVGPDQFDNEGITEPQGINLDKLDIEISNYAPDEKLLKLEYPAGVETKASVTEKVFSRLMKSNCPVTDQPDWACVTIEYSGQAISHTSLLAYIVSYRLHNGFHEHCVEKIFHDIMTQCKPTALSVYARYTRRGGLDINPWRATAGMREPILSRSARQ